MLKLFKSVKIVNLLLDGLMKLTFLNDKIEYEY